MFGLLRKLSKRAPKKPVAIVTPIHRLPLTAEEEISLQHLRHFLGEFDRFFIAPEGFRVDFPDFKTRFFDQSYFQGVTDYSRLMLNPEFYKAFSDYEYILLYQLDCLVFSSDLEAWCRKQWDYAGAPWFENFQQDASGALWAVGNGGLSLRHIEHSVEALRRKQALEKVVLKAVGKEVLQANDSTARSRVKKFLQKEGLPNNPQWYTGHPPRKSNEDLFWAFEAKQLMPEFSIPTPQEALAFSFEYAPRVCFERNACQLPFGCHAWARYDIEFWKPHLLENHPSTLSPLP